jgi:poly-beta-1,6-N-acetyl-D-glucosamine N-deacetylase
MAKAGVTIANHSSSHAHLVRRAAGESLEQWRARIKEDIADAQEKISQQLGAAPKFMAYPFGEYDVELQKLVKEMGYLAFGQQSGPLYEKGNLQALPRFPFGGSFTDLDDFILKVNTRPLPLGDIEFYADKSTAINNLIVQEGAQPWLVFKLENAALLNSVRCYATGQGAITTQVIDGRLWAQAKQPLSQGRTRYNCTAPTGEKGRFYWYTQQWLVSDKQGEWNYPD